METKQITHPKLYFDYQEVDNGIKLFYYSNIIDDSGTRVAQSHIIDYDVFSDQDLSILNRKEYDKLLIYIARQEKVLKIYSIKNLKDQYQIVKDSLDMMYDFKHTFDDQFKFVNKDAFENILN
tara:strand:+ start:2316 stop:2684 length:369 start_codon:yes stop_codon:yes gene_type:complete